MCFPGWTVIPRERELSSSLLLDNESQPANKINISGKIQLENDLLENGHQVKRFQLRIQNYF